MEPAFGAQLCDLWPVAAQLWASGQGRRMMNGMLGDRPGTSRQHLFGIVSGEPTKQGAASGAGGRQQSGGCGPQRVVWKPRRACGFLGAGTPREAGRQGPRRGQSRAQRKHPRGPCVPSTVTVPETISPYFSCLGACLIPHRGIATEGGLQHQCVSYERETEAQRGNYGVPGAGQRCPPHCDSPVSLPGQGKWGTCV